MTDKTRRRLEKIEGVIKLEGEPEFDMEICFVGTDGTREVRMLSSFRKPEKAGPDGNTPPDGGTP